MATTDEFLDKYLLAPVGYIPSAPDLSAVATVADPPLLRTEAIIDWAVNTASSDDLDAALATLTGPPPF